MAIASKNLIVMTLGLGGEEGYQNTLDESLKQVDSTIDILKNIFIHCFVNESVSVSEF